MRTLASTASGRVKLLHTVANYWRRNSQFHLIVIDKLLQYRLVDPADVITWIFSTNSQGVKQSWSDMNTYDLLKTTVGIVQSKVEGCRGRLAGVRREEEAKAAVAELDNLTCLYFLPILLKVTNFYSQMNLKK